MPMGQITRIVEESDLQAIKDTIATLAERVDELDERLSKMLNGPRHIWD